MYYYLFSLVVYVLLLCFNKYNQNYNQLYAKVKEKCYFLNGSSEDATLYQVSWMKQGTFFLS